MEESVEREVGAVRARPLDAGLAERRVELTLVTAAPPSRPAEPFELPERAQRLRARVDWDAY
ncbi:MAG TPA: hypothetical protein VHG09_06040, partial [Longimicrobiales bacterium]|nr:hypothetical protein [Longimicrobiales bacterium]